VRLLREDVGPALDRHVGWSLTGWAALELSAPFTTTIPSLHIYVVEDDFAGPLSAAIADADLREVDSGGRVTFWAADARLLRFAAARDGIPVASPPRIYADLTGFGARGLDAAAHLKEQLIDPLHRSSNAHLVADGSHG
jgi:hypothetical protein